MSPRAAGPHEAAKPSRLLTAEEVAERWRVPKSQVYRLAREERLPFIAVGRYRRFSLDAIETFEREGGADA